MFRSYRYIIANDANPGLAIENDYSPESLQGRFIVYSKKQGYRVYESLCDFHTYLQGPDAIRTWNEVILDGPQKLKFDIDAPSKLFVDATAYNAVFNTILDGIKDVISITFGISLKPTDIIICKSHGPSKYSNHIIIDNYCVSNALQARELTSRLMMLIPQVTVLDIGVNKSRQNFRILHCHKEEDPSRPKVLVTQHDPMRTYIGNTTDCKLLHDITTVAAKEVITPITSNVEAIVASYCPADHVYRSTSGNRILFTRTAPGYCILCARVHSNDNTFYIRVMETPEETCLYQHCRHYDDDYGGCSLISHESHVPEGSGKSYGSYINRLVSRAARYKVNGNVFAPEIDHVIHEYAEPVLRPFELCESLVVHAGMKMGKTKALVDYLATHFGSRLVAPKIRFISFRRTFSANIKNKFPDFQLYSDTTGYLYANKIIVQVESLHRLAIVPGEECPDLLILDESESIFEQFDSGLLKHFNECFAKFQYLMRYSKHVICMDANIGQRTINILSQMRPARITYHHNVFKNAAPDTYYLTDNKAKWLGILFAALETDRVAIPMSSLADAKTIYKLITSRRPDLRVHIYTSETSLKEKNEHFGAVDNYWALYDVLIYTPTVSAGVSFEVKHYKKVFGYFSDMSCPVETCCQMMGRIRDVADKSYFIYMDITHVTRPVSIADIRAQVISRRECLHSSFDSMGLTAEYDSTGAVKIHESPYFGIYLENTRVKNISSVYFCKQFIHVLGYYGAAVEDITDDVFEQLCGYGPGNSEVTVVCKEYKETTQEGKKATIDDVYAAKDITEVEAAELRLLEEPSSAERNELSRYYLRRHYNYKGPLTKKFIAKYDRDRIRRVYKNWVRLEQPDALEGIKQTELANFTTLQELGHDYHHKDIKYRYVYNQHRYALGLLKLFGWTGPDDDSYVNVNDLDTAVYAKNIHAICLEFNKRQTSNVEKIDTIVALVNDILLEMYGVKMFLVEKDIYKLRRNKNFTRDPTCIDRPCISI